MQREENKNVTHLPKKRRTRGIFGDLPSGLFCWQMQSSGARNHTLTRELCWDGKRMLLSFLLRTKHQAVTSLRPPRPPHAPQSKSPAPL
jgi:hypothetical protein